MSDIEKEHALAIAINQVLRLTDGHAVVVNIGEHGEVVVANSQGETSLHDPMRVLVRSYADEVYALADYDYKKASTQVRLKVNAILKEIFREWQQ